MNSDNNPTLPKGYTPKQVTKIIPIGYRTILDLIYFGKLKATRVGRKYIISEKNIDDFLDTGK